MYSPAPVLTPLRLSISGKVIADEELQGPIQSKVQRVVLKRADLKPAIAAAYKSANPAPRTIFESALKDADPKFLATLRARE